MKDMNEQNNLSQGLVDQHVLNLLNASIDGEINATDRQELENLLLASGEVRSLKQELEAFTAILDELPEVDPPDFLQETIERQIRLPAQGRSDVSGPGSWSDWLSANWLRGGFALAAGLFLAVSVYEMGSEPITPGDGASMVGTVANKNIVNQPGTLIDSVNLTNAQLEGVVELRNKGDLYTLDLQLNSGVAAEVIVNFAGRGLVFEGAVGDQISPDTLSIQEGDIHIASSGRQSYTISFKRSPSEGTRYAGPLELSFIADSKLIQQEKLIIPRP